MTSRSAVVLIGSKMSVTPFGYPIRIHHTLVWLIHDLWHFDEQRNYENVGFLQSFLNEKACWGIHKATLLLQWQERLRITSSYRGFTCDMTASLTLRIFEGSFLDHTFIYSHLGSRRGVKKGATTWTGILESTPSRATKKNSDVSGLHKRTYATHHRPIGGIIINDSPVSITQKVCFVLWTRRKETNAFQISNMRCIVVYQTWFLQILR